MLTISFHRHLAGHLITSIFGYKHLFKDKLLEPELVIFEGELLFYLYCNIHKSSIQNHRL